MSARGARLAAVLAGASLALCATGVLAASGWVHDESDRAVEGASVCLKGEADTLCYVTKADGYYELPTALPTLEIRADGYLPVEVAADDRETPVVLREASRFRVRFLDATDGDARPEGAVRIYRADGTRMGSFPVVGDGLYVKQYWPGEYVVTAEAAGYRREQGIPLRLPVGREVVLEVTLTPDTSGADE